MKTNFLKNPISRRNFLITSAVTAFTTAITLSPAALRTAMATSRMESSTDLDILQYALTLEHLEDAAYRFAIGSGLLSGTALKYFQQFGAHEATHVATLTKVITSLGGTPVAEQAKYNLPALTSQQGILTYFQVVEELGAAAYLGQAPRLQSPDLLTAAVSIHNVEAQHAAVLSDLIGVSPAPVFGTPKTMEQVLAVVGPILGAAPAGAAASAPAAAPGMPNTGRGGSSYTVHARNITD